MLTERGVAENNSPPLFNMATNMLQEPFSCHLRYRQSLVSGEALRLSQELSRFVYYRYGRREELQRKSLAEYGSVFNMEFSLINPYVLLVAHSMKAVTIHDSRLEKRVLAIPRAHDNCINIITFIDNFTFATGSDDETIRLWDARKCGTRDDCMGVLRGHRGWVKNIEYDTNSKTMYSIAFNDGVRKWNLNDLDEYSERVGGVRGGVDNLLFAITDGVRMKLSSDSSTMAISARKNHIYVVSDFDSDLVGVIWNCFPYRLPLEESHLLNIESYSANQRNKPSIHCISHLTEPNYETPLSMSFLPSSSSSCSLLGLRSLSVLIEENLLLSLSETTKLYNVSADTDLNTDADTDLSNDLNADTDAKDDSDSDTDSNTDTNASFFDYEHTSRNCLNSINEYSIDEAVEYIKEISFSTDGRLLVSPYGNGVRLLSVDNDCTPIGHYYHANSSSEGAEFKVVATCTGDDATPVLTSRLNSNTMCLASGSEGGRVVFYSPRL